MSEMAACVRCGERFFVGFKTDRPTCGICAPRNLETDWSRIPRRAPAWEGPPDSVAPGGVEKGGL
jgi:hypothetical protein